MNDRDELINEHMAKSEPTESQLYYIRKEMMEMNKSLKCIVKALETIKNRV